MVALHPLLCPQPAVPVTILVRDSQQASFRVSGIQLSPSSNVVILHLFSVAHNAYNLLPLSKGPAFCTVSHGAFGGSLLHHAMVEHP